MGDAAGPRLILSRKGFDSDFGGAPSPILPDGSTYLELLERLGIGQLRPSGWRSEPLPVAELGAHLDPDLSRSTLPRPPGWRPLFGQVDRAQGHLRNQGVGPGDLFLSFGLFAETARLPSGRLRTAGRRHWIHLLWGWLEVDRVLPVGDGLPDELPWATGHPHWRARHLDRYRRQNTLYVARERSTLLPGLPGAGVFPCYRPSLRLSRPGSLRSVWRLPRALHPDHTPRPR
jgi:hypothetical protein